jgi:hypothetical protein
MTIRQCALATLMAVMPAVAMAEKLECYLPSLKDGSVLERMNISRHEGRTVVRHLRAERAYRDGSEQPREVLYAHDSNPVEQYANGKQVQWEPPHSVLLLRSASREIEFAPDLLVIDWQANRIKTGSPYQTRFIDRWQCVAVDS